MSSLATASRRYVMSYIGRSSNGNRQLCLNKMRRMNYCTLRKRNRYNNNINYNKYSLIRLNKYFFSDNGGSGIHPDFQTSYKTGDIDQVKKQIETDINENETFLFMKGSPSMPQCGFSKNLITILNYLEIQYQTRDVLSHPALRQAVKEYRYLIFYLFLLVNV